MERDITSTDDEEEEWQIEQISPIPIHNEICHMQNENESENENLNIPNNEIIGNTNDNSIEQNQLEQQNQSIAAQIVDEPDIMPESDVPLGIAMWSDGNIRIICDSTQLKMIQPMKTIAEVMWKIFFKGMDLV